MDSLRWILLLIGAAIVAGIWWSGHRRSRERDETLFERARRAPDDETMPAGIDTEATHDFDISSLERATVDADADGDPSAITPDEPAAQEEPQVSEPAATAGGGSPAANAEPGARGDGEERLEAVYVVAPPGERFIGSRLQELFAHHGLEHGELEIYHMRDAEGHTLFSVANLIEPGTFDPGTMDTMSTPGVALFLRLPGPPSAETAFDRMMDTARGLAEALEARLLDQQHSTLTRQTEQHLRDQMREFDHLRQRGGR